MGVLFFAGMIVANRRTRHYSADTARRVPAFLRKTKRVVRKQNSFRTVCPKRLLQLSAAGEVFLEGCSPSESLSADSEIPAPCFWRTGKVGEKSDSFSRAERTRPLRPCVPLAVSRFWKRSGGTFPTGYSFPETSGHGTPCPYRRILSLFCGRNTECFT